MATGSTPRARGPWFVAASVVLAVVAVVLLALSVRDSGMASPTSAAPAESTASTASPPASTPIPSLSSAAALPTPQDSAPTGSAPADGAETTRPVRIQIPAIGVDAHVGELGIGADGAIEVPDDPDQAGWLDTSALPGQTGPAVVAGHVDSTTGPAVFYRLSELAPGDEIVITRRDGSAARFTVDGVRDYLRDRFPTQQVYGPAPGPVLRLITCGGAYDSSSGGYQSNVVVFAS